MACHLFESLNHFEQSDLPLSIGQFVPQIKFKINNLVNFKDTKRSPLKEAPLVVIQSHLDRLKTRDFFESLSAQDRWFRHSLTSQIIADIEEYFKSLQREINPFHNHTECIIAQNCFIDFQEEWGKFSNRYK